MFPSGDFYYLTEKKILYYSLILTEVEVSSTLLNILKLTRNSNTLYLCLNAMLQ